MPRTPLPVPLRHGRLVAILRARSSDRFVEIATTLAGAGLQCVEITLNSGGALAAIAAVRAGLPDSVAVGAGTVTTVDEADAAVRAGAGFLVSPHTDVSLIQHLAGRRVPYVPGAHSATEVLTAWRAGAAAVKLFPAGVAGPAYLAALRGPFPDIPLLPTGGVEISMVSGFLAAGAVAVGLGAPLQGDAAEGGSLTALAERARLTVAQARGDIHERVA